MNVDDTLRVPYINFLSKIFSMIKWIYGFFYFDTKKYSLTENRQTLKRLHHHFRNTLSAI